LPETPDSETTSRMSSESWKAAPTTSPYFVRASWTSVVAPPKIAPYLADVAISEPVLPATTSR